MEGVRGVKSKDGPDLIVWGSSTLTPLLLEQGLVDEVLLLVYPVLLGRGKRFFSDSADPRELALVSTKSASSGVLMNTYRPLGSLRTESFAERERLSGRPSHLKHRRESDCPKSLFGSGTIC